MSRRYYLTTAPDSDFVRLTGREAHHVQHVLRSQVGDQIELFDGRGTEHVAEIIEGGSDSLLLRILQTRVVSPASAQALTIAAAVPKGDRLKGMIEKLTELGVSRYIPLITERSVVDPRDGKLDRLRQTVIEAAKQSGATQLMEILPRCEWKELLNDVSVGQLWVADPSGEPLTIARLSTLPDHPVIAIGPEGGFTMTELEQARQRGAERFGLTGNILRIETASVASAVLFRHAQTAMNKHGD